MFLSVPVYGIESQEPPALQICSKERIRPKSVFGRRIHSKLGGMHSKLGGIHSNLAVYTRGRIHSQKLHFRVFAFGVHGITTFLEKSVFGRRNTLFSEALGSFRFPSGTRLNAKCTICVNVFIFYLHGE